MFSVISGENKFRTLRFMAIFALLRENRMRFGIIKLENFVFVCLCSHLSLSLRCYAKIGCVSAKSSNKFDFLHSTFIIFAEDE